MTWLTLTCSVKIAAVPVRRPAGIRCATPASSSFADGAASMTLAALFAAEVWVAPLAITCEICSRPCRSTGQGMNWRRRHSGRLDVAFMWLISRR